MKTAALLLCYRLFRRVLGFEAKTSSHTRPRKQSTTRALRAGGQAHWASARLPGSDFRSPFNRSAGRSAGYAVRLCQCAVTVDEGLRRGPAASEQELASEWRAGGLAAAARSLTWSKQRQWLRPANHRDLDQTDDMSGTTTD